jgi:UDP-GlcNAc:undecaprenyl-phosphate/decaprenyl-phosphate GlcNAc-1-phosphate transferase
MNFFYEMIELLKIPLFGLFLTFLVVSKNWLFFFNTLGLKTYSNIQRFHSNEIPRLGGVLIYLFLVTTFVFGFVNEDLIIKIIISSLLLILVGFIEDFFHCIKPPVRIISLIISSLIFLKIYDITFPSIELPLFYFLSQLEILNLIFFTFSILVVTNGVNLIDGMNGLAAFTVLSQLLSLLLLAIYFNDYEIQKIIIILILPLVLFLFFNFPMGKIFFGDSGAYFYGFANSCITIVFFGKHPMIYSWVAVLILLYPSIELLFSFIRKKYSGISPLQADNMHLHSKICTYLQKRGCSQIKANNFTTVMLSIIWLSPLLSIFIFQKLFLILLSIILITLLYLFCYHILRKL